VAATPTRRHPSSRAPQHGTRPAAPCCLPGWRARAAGRRPRHAPLLLLPAGLASALAAACAASAAAAAAHARAHAHAHRQGTCT
jgi:hypothetical protein